MIAFTYIDVIGWIATALTLLSFLSTKMEVLRMVNLLGCFFWIAFGLLNKTNPIIVTNAVIATIHLVWFYKWKFKNK